jgi:hypothetical protein
MHLTGGIASGLGRSFLATLSRKREKEKNLDSDM